jgi:hypothetical protein
MRRRVVVPMLVVCFAAATALAQVSSPADAAWRYPRAPRRDPVAPPAELYDVDGRSRLEVRTIVLDPRVPRRSKAVVRLVGPVPVRAVVRAGDRVGAYRIQRVEMDRVVAVLHVLGADHAVVVPVVGDSARAAGVSP